MSANKTILDQATYRLMLSRLCFQLIENHENFANSVIVGLQPRGVQLSKRIQQALNQITGTEIPYGELDVTFFRDDFRTKPLIPQTTLMDTLIEGKKVILVDDVLFTGRSVRAGMDALLQFGRPSKIELLVLVDRRWSREIPISPDYVGLTVDAVFSEKVSVQWDGINGPAEVVLLTKNTKE